MTTKQFETWLAEAIDAQSADDDNDRIRRVETNEEAGILTSDPGLVVTFEDGSEVQISIVRSKLARDGSHPDEEDESEDDEEDDGSLAYAARVNGLGDRS